MDFINKEFLDETKENFCELRLKINKFASSQLLLSIKFNIIDKEKIKKLLSLTSCLIHDKMMSRNIFHELAKVKDKEIYDLFFLHIQETKEIEKSLLIQSFDFCDDSSKAPKTPKTPLFEAIEHDNSDFIKSLIKCGFDTNKYQKINPDKYLFLLSYIDCNQLTIKSASISPLALAIEENKLKIFNELLSCKNLELGSPAIKLELIDKDKKIIERKISLLEFAIILDNEYAVESLTFFDIKVFLTPDEQLRCLYYAVLSKNENIFCTLFFKKFDIFLKDSRGFSALDYAIIYNSSEIIMNCFLLKKISFDQESKYQLEDGKWIFMQPMQFAVSFANYETIEALVNLGANINYKSSSQISAMSLAISARNKVLIKFLIEHNARISYSEIEQVCQAAKFSKIEAQRMKNFIDLCLFEKVERKLLMRKAIHKCPNLTSISSYVSLNYFNKFRYIFHEFHNQFDSQINEIFKSQNALNYFQNIENNLIDFFLNMKLVREKKYLPEQITTEILKQRTEVPFFCILTSLRNRNQKLDLDQTLSLILSLDEICLTFLAGQIAKIMTIEKMPNFESQLFFSYDIAEFLQNQQEIKINLNPCYHQKFDEALELFREIVRVNNFKFLPDIFSENLPANEISQIQILSLIDSLQIATRFSKTNYPIKDLNEMINSFLIASVNHKDRDPKDNIKHNPKILIEVKKFTKCLLQEYSKSLSSQKLFSIDESDHREQISSNRPSRSQDQGNKDSRPKTKFSTKQTRKIRAAIKLQKESERSEKIAKF